jgi:hypothetical protein
MKTLVNWSTNWADEMDIDGWIITDSTEVSKWKAILLKARNLCIGFGTNEWNDYSTGQEILDECEISEISDGDAKVIEKYFGDHGGNTGFWDQVFDHEEEEEEDEENLFPFEFDPEDEE